MIQPIDDARLSLEQRNKRDFIASRIKYLESAIRAEQNAITTSHRHDRHICVALCATISTMALVTAWLLT